MTEAEWIALAMKRKALRRGHTHDPEAKARFLRWFRSVERLCSLCGKAGRIDRGDLNVDHCHRTGMVRGILCARCNKALSFCWDDPDWRRRALEYLGKDLGIRIYKVDRRKANRLYDRKTDTDSKKFGCRHGDRCCHKVHK